MVIENQHDAKRLHYSQINKALGVFLVFFALVVLMSVFFTDTKIGKLTNLGGGGRHRRDRRCHGPEGTQGRPQAATVDNGSLIQQSHSDWLPYITVSIIPPEVRQ